MLSQLIEKVEKNEIYLLDNGKYIIINESEYVYEPKFHNIKFIRETLEQENFENNYFIIGKRNGERISINLV